MWVPRPKYIFADFIVYLFFSVKTLKDKVRELENQKNQRERGHIIITMLPDTI